MDRLPLPSLARRTALSGALLSGSVLSLALLSVALPGASVRAQTGTAPARDPSVQARLIFVLNSQDASVSVVDPVTYAEVKRIAVGKEPHHLYLTPDRKSLLVANALSNSLTFIDPATAQVQRTLTGIADP